MGKYNILERTEDSCIYKKGDAWSGSGFAAFPHSSEEEGIHAKILMKEKRSVLTLKQKFAIIALCIGLICIGAAISLPFVNHEHMTSIMQKTFPTDRSAEWLRTQVNSMCEISSIESYENGGGTYPVKVVKSGKIRVKDGRFATYWELNLDTPGEIVVERCMLVTDWILVLSLGMIDLVCAYLILNDKFSFNRVVIVLGLALFEALPLYYLQIMRPINMIQSFIEKFLI